MFQFNADDGEIAYVNCGVCEKAIIGGKWFARIKHGDVMVALCCPLCAEAFEAAPSSYVRRIQTLAEMAARMEHQSRAAR